MKIVFFRKNEKNPSFMFYAQLLKEGTSEGRLDLQETNNLDQVDDTHPQILLMMGAEYDESMVRAQKMRGPNVLVGAIDPRPSICKNLRGVDFIIANGIESQDFYYQFCDNVFVYYTYPFLKGGDEARVRPNEDRFTMGYHGNKIHLESMIPRITDAINAIAAQRPILLKCIYNVKELGRSWRIDRALKCDVQHIQYSEEAYTALGDCHLGLMPQLIPIQRKNLVHWVGSTLLRRNNEEKSDYFLRFKPTTNIGRLLVFAQMKIPVICDLAPSTAHIIENNVSGYLAHHTAAWAHWLEKAADGGDNLRIIGDNLFQLFQNKFHPKKQNQALLKYLQDLKR